MIQHQHLAAAPPPPADWSVAWPALMQFWPVLAVAFGASLLLTPVMRRLAIANGIVDLPDARRKAHAKPVAYLGGLAIFLGWFAAVGLFVGMLLAGPGHGGLSLHAMIGADQQTNDVMSVILIAIGAAAIVLTGLFDDVYGMRARVKIGGQLFAAAAIAQARAVEDLVARSLDLLNITLPDPMMQVVGTAMIAVLVVGCCNALNLIDGLDGLASGVTTIAMAGMLAICALVIARYADNASVVSHLGVPILLSVATIGAVAGFLPYNFNPASIFMGDTGSLLLGYLCVTTILFMGRLDNDAGLAPLAFSGAVICFALPMTDTALAIVRRKLQGKPIFAPDAMHMHHMFRRCGLSVKQSVFCMYTLGLIFAGTGFALVALSLRWGMSMTFFGLTVLVILIVGYRVSCRLQRSEAEHPKPAEGPDNRPGKDDDAPNDTLAQTADPAPLEPAGKA
ncbi:MAG: glycosyltransferase family 4 protein [Phycisphaeraceae bacterium]